MEDIKKIQLLIGRDISFKSIQCAGDREARPYTIITVGDSPGGDSFQKNETGIKKVMAGTEEEIHESVKNVEAVLNGHYSLENVSESVEIIQDDESGRKSIRCCTLTGETPYLSAVVSDLFLRTNMPSKLFLENTEGYDLYVLSSGQYIKTPNENIAIARHVQRSMPGMGDVIDHLTILSNSNIRLDEYLLLCSEAEKKGMSAIEYYNHIIDEHMENDGVKKDYHKKGELMSVYQGFIERGGIDPFVPIHTCAEGNEVRISPTDKCRDPDENPATFHPDHIGPNNPLH